LNFEDKNNTLIFIIRRSVLPRRIGSAKIDPDSDWNAVRIFPLYNSYMLIQK
jgi:hypothetical protein